jgi:hypothetical protein
MANNGRDHGRWIARAALVLVVLGGALIAAAAMTPWHTDSDAYFEGLNSIRASLYGGMGASVEMDSFDRASRDFHALQDRYETSKWLYADLGYAAVSWALLLIVVAVVNPTVGGDRRWRVVVPASLAAVALTVVGVAASAFHLSGRQQLPEWSDTLAIPLMGAAGLGMVLLPAVLCLALAPLVFTRRVPVGLWSMRGRGWGTAIPVSLIYLGPALLGALALVTILEAGGWAISTGGAILLWLMLNARAVWLGRTEGT